jgi:hypothetical protein
MEPYRSAQVLLDWARRFTWLIAAASSAAEVVEA